MIIKPLKLLPSATLLCLLSSGSFAQTPTTATYIPESDIMTVYEQLQDSIDQQIRVVDIGDDINVAVGILRRESSRTEDGEGVTALIHHQVTEVYYVLSGSGVLVTGGAATATSGRELPAESAAVKELIGPSAFRTLANGQTKTISPGDVVVIPAGVPHGFRQILDQITYLSIRVDPDQVLPEGYKHPVLD